MKIMKEEKKKPLTSVTASELHINNPTGEIKKQ